MGNTRAMREKNTKAVAGSRKRRAEDKRREQRREDKIKSLRETRWEEKLESNHKELRRKRGETLTKEEVRLVLSTYCHYFLDEEVTEDALHKVLLITGISKGVLDRVVEDWEC